MCGAGVDRPHGRRADTGGGGEFTDEVSGPSQREKDLTAVLVPADDGDPAAVHREEEAAVVPLPQQDRSSPVGAEASGVEEGVPTLGPEQCGETAWGEGRVTRMATHTV